MRCGSGVRWWSGRVSLPRRRFRGLTARPDSRKGPARGATGATGTRAGPCARTSGPSESTPRRRGRDPDAEPVDERSAWQIDPTGGRRGRCRAWLPSDGGCRLSRAAGGVDPAPVRGSGVNLSLPLKFPAASARARPRQEVTSSFGGSRAWPCGGLVPFLALGSRPGTEPSPISDHRVAVEALQQYFSSGLVFETVCRSPPATFSLLRPLVQTKRQPSRAPEKR